MMMRTPLGNWQIQARCFISERQNDVVSAVLIFFSSQLINRADRKLFKQTQLSRHCLNSLLPSSRLPCSCRYSLRSRRHQFSLPQLNTVLYNNMFVNRCLFQYIEFYHFSSLYCFFSSSLFVLKVQISPLFIKGSTWLDIVCVVNCLGS